jgi:hypothetical protein
MEREAEELFSRAEEVAERVVRVGDAGVVVDEGDGRVDPA